MHHTTQNHLIRICCRCGLVLGTKPGGPGVTHGYGAHCHAIALEEVHANHSGRNASSSNAPGRDRNDDPGLGRVELAEPAITRLGQSLTGRSGERTA